MKKNNFLLLLILSLFIISCGSNSGKKTSDFSLKIVGDSNEFQLGESLRANLENKKNRQIDSVTYYFQQEHLKTSAETEIEIQLKDQKLGTHSLQAIVYFEGKADTAAASVKVYHHSAPVSYTYKVIAEYPHDAHAYTQGLEFYNDTLYESTGQYGKSSLRKVDLKSGEILKKIDLEDSYFAEGLSILNDKIHLLTWREGEGFIYDLGFNLLESFSYNQSKEGWGLCNDGEKLYKSDGSEKIWRLNAQNLAEEDFIQITTHRSTVTQMNELEWIDGRIYANTYQKDGVAIINPDNGAVEGLIDFRGLRDRLGNTAELDERDHVLNGIAYQESTGRIYVTGKHWDKIFEVEILEK